VFGVLNIDIFALDGNATAPAPLVEGALGSDSFQTAVADVNDVYRASWDISTAVEGQHDLTARMTDSLENQATATIQVLVNNQPPGVAFISPDPADGPVSGNVSLVATADTDGSVVSVTFFDGATVIGTDNNPGDGISVNWKTNRVAKEDHLLTVKATDNLGQVSDPGDSITVTVASGKGGGGGGGPGGGPGGEKCFKNKEPLCAP
jgi:hypothetical protein